MQLHVQLMFHFYNVHLNVYSQIPISALRYSASLVNERQLVQIAQWARFFFHFVFLAFFAWQTVRISQYK